MARTQSTAVSRSRGVSSILETRVRQKSILELRALDGTIGATVEIPAPSSTGAKVRLRQTAWTAAELQRLVRVLTRAAEKLDA